MAEKRMLEEAEKFAAEALVRDSNSDFEAASHFYQLALIVMPDNKDYDDCYNRWTAALNEARKNSPSHQASTYKTQGDMATKTKDWKGAVEAYKQAVNLQPNREDYKAALEEAEKLWKKQQQDTEAEEEERKLREVILQRKKDLEDQKRRMEEDLRRQEAEKQEREERRLAELKRLEEERIESERIKEEEEQRKRKEQEERDREAEQKRLEEAQRLEESRKRQQLEDNERQKRREARKTALLSKDTIIPEGEEIRSMTSRKPRVDDDHKTEADDERPRRRHQRDLEGEDSILREPMSSREHSSGKTGPSSTEDRRAEVARRRKARQEEEERIAQERAERRKRRQERGNNT